MTKLTVICGPMFGGKTQEMIRRYRSLPKDQCIAIKPAMDVRYGKNITAHTGDAIEAVSLHNLQEIGAMAGGYQYVFIDEGQFFIDLAEKCRELLQMGKLVCISGLNATADQKPWNSMSEVIAMADEIVFKTDSLCELCNISHATHTVRRDGKTSSIKIGGSDLYMSVCRKCLSHRLHRI